MEEIYSRMSTFITTPNLPEGRVRLAAVGNYPEILAALHSLGIDTFSLESDILPDEISRHQDMLLCHTGGSSVFLDPAQNKAPLEKEGFTVKTVHPLKKTYPGDALLNVAVSKDFFIYNPKSADPTLVGELTESGKIPVRVKQGYTKCSLCFVTENALITEDPSVYEALRDTESHVLLISKGDIYLSDEHYGFFGGSTGKIDKHTLAVTGAISSHRDGEKIKDFCHSHNVNILELTSGRITDIGGILPLK